MAFFPNSLRAQLFVVAAVNLLCIGGMVASAFYLTALQKDVTVVHGDLTGFHRMFDRLQVELAEMRHVQIEYSGSPKIETEEKAVAKIRESRSGIDRIESLNDSYEKANIEMLSDKIDLFEDKFAVHAQHAEKLYLDSIDASYTRLKSNTEKLVGDVRPLNNFALLSAAEDLRAIVNSPDCGAAVKSAYAFRKLIENSLSALSQSALPIRNEILIHSAVNQLRGQYGSFILQCREFERQRLDLRSLSNDIIEMANVIIDPLGDIIDSKVEAIFEEQRTIVILVLSVSIVFLTLAIFATLFIFKNMSERLLGIRDAIQAIARGNVGIDVPYTQNSGETGDVARAVEEFRLNKLALSQALSEAVAAEKAKTEFLGTMSHELRTPLNIVIGYSEAMKNGIFGELPARYQEPATQILGSGTHLLNIINQVLDMVSLGNATDSDTRTLLQPESELDPVLRSLEAVRHEKGVTINCDLPPQIRIFCNATHFRQIVTNLIDNALKFTDPGTTLEIRCTEICDGRVVISIRDEGPGMSKSEVERALQPFVQIGDHLTRRHGGVGLGLAIVARLCELNGGSVVFESEKGKGTTVSLTMPSGRVLAEEIGLRGELEDGQCMARAS